MVELCDRQPGKVVAEKDGQIAVLTQARGGCGRCQSPGGCGRPMDERPSTTWVSNEQHFQVGDAVDLVVETPALERAAAHAYGIPLAALLAGAGLGQAWGDVAALIGAAIGLFFGLGWARWQAHKLSPHLWAERAKTD